MTGVLCVENMLLVKTV